MKNFVRVPKTLTFEKVFALVLLCRNLFPVKGLGELRDLLASREVELSFEDEAAPTTGIVHDLDVAEPYNRSEGRYGSAAHKVVETFGLQDMAGVEKAVEWLNQNNRDGFLKKYPKSVVTLIRGLYEVGHSCDTHTHRLNVVLRIWLVVQAYLEACEVDETEAIASSQGQPFSLTHVRSLCQLAGYDTKSTDTLCNDLEHGFQQAKTRQQQAVHRADKKPAEPFDVRTVGDRGTVSGHLISSDDDELAGPYFKANPNAVVLVQRRSNGSYSIHVRGQQDLSLLYEALEELEPTRWYHYRPAPPQSPGLHNGGPSRAPQPSSQKPRELIALIQQFVRCQPRERQSA